MTVAGGHPRSARRLAGFSLGAVASGLLTYAALGLAGQELRLNGLRVGPALLVASGAFLAIWHGWWKRIRPIAPTGRQISKTLARAPRARPFAYGAVLGAGMLTIVSTPAVWLGAGCSLLLGSFAWGGLYGLSFGMGRGLMLAHDAYRFRDRPPAAAGFLVLGRVVDPRSRFWVVGAAGGLTLAGLAVLSLLVPGR
jgi:hypothetical protein